jgi:hypothetical protein
MNKLKGLFLGAGFSYEAGMPLMWELTSDIKEWLSRTSFAISILAGESKVAVILTASSRT